MKLNKNFLQKFPLFVTRMPIIRVTEQPTLMLCSAENNKNKKKIL